MYPSSATSSNTEHASGAAAIRAPAGDVTEDGTSQPLGLAEQSQAGLVRRARESSSPPHGLRQPNRKLLIAWLLLLVDRQATYGYELRRQLEALGVAAETGAMYRTLRKLERDGYVSSSWAEPVAGPARRQYQLTTTGRSRLGELVRAITDTRDGHAAFLHVHEALSPERA